MGLGVFGLTLKIGMLDVVSSFHSSTGSSSFHWFTAAGQRVSGLFRCVIMLGLLMTVGRG